MIELKVDNERVEGWNGFSIKLEYDSLSSSFDFDVHFDPENELHKRIFKPGAYKEAEVFYKGELLIRGPIIVQELADGSSPDLVGISGYSKTGVLEDCTPHPDSYPLQSQNKTIKEICEDLCGPFGISVSVDPSVQGEANEQIESTDEDPSDGVADYISEICGQKDIIVSHTAEGDLLLTSARTSATPLMDLFGGPPATDYALSFDGQSMHSKIKVQKQSSPTGGNSAQAEIDNPLVDDERPTVAEQTSGDDVDTEKAARNALASELKSLTLDVDLDRWEIDGELIKPNNIVRVKRPRLYLYNPTKFFIREVELNGSEAEMAASISCVLPEVFSKEKPQRIFD